MKKTLLAAMLTLALAPYTLAQEMNRDLHQGETFELCHRIPNNVDNTYTASNYIKLRPGFASKPVEDKTSLLNIGLDELGIYPPESGYTNEDGSVVGSLGGTVNVGSMGGLNYTIPIQIPVGINGMQPDISIDYNSQGGNGLLGWGWDLGGLSCISRTGQTLYHDGNMTAANLTSDDRFLLDGQRLMPIHGKYGNANSEYRTENDRMAKIMLLADDESKEGRQMLYFKVWEMSGNILEYHARLCSPDGSKVILWMISSVTDRYGNAIKYHYHTNNETGEMRIENIEYTVNENQGETAQFCVEFQYKQSDRFDYDYYYIGGCKLLYNDLLESIKVMDKTAEKTLFAYKFNYIEQFGDINRQYYILSTINMLAYDEDGILEKYNPTTINWSTTLPGYTKKVPVTNSEILEEFPFLGDFNGDGYTDVATVPYKPHDSAHYDNPVDIKIYLNDRNHGFTRAANMDLHGVNKTLDWVYVFDINDDGLDDIVPYFSTFKDEDNYEEDGKTSIYVYRNDRYSFTLTGNREVENRSSVVTGDFDGNGTVDIIMLEREPHWFFHGYWFAGEHITYLENIYWLGIIDGQLQTRHLNNRPLRKRIGPLYDAVSLDYNGDGISEVLLIGIDADYVDNNGSKLAVFDFNGSENGMSITETYTSHYTDPVYEYKINWSHVFPGDYNGDGKTDIIYNTGTYWRIRFSNGDCLGQPWVVSGIREIGYYRNLFAPSLKLASNVSNSNKLMMSVADFDGDGCSDFCYADEGNNRMFVLSKIDSQPTTGHYYLEFRRKKKLNITFNFRSQFTHVGNFLGEDHASFLETIEPSHDEKSGNAYILSPAPVTEYNSVTSITDGMGNNTAFTYDFLMPSREDNDDPFYTFSYAQPNQCNTQRTPLAVRALRTSEVKGINGSSTITKYSYGNAYNHKTGHGFVGFEKTFTETYRNSLEAGWRTRTECWNELGTMDSYSMMLPEKEFTYVNNNGIAVLVNKKTFDFSRICYRIVEHPRLVVCPAMKCQKEYFYNIDEDGELLKTIITDYMYTYNNLHTYTDSYYCKKSTQTITGYNEGNSRIELVTVKEAQKNSFVDNWIINRPDWESVTLTRNGRTKSSHTIYEYGSDNKHEPSDVTLIPNNGSQPTDPLTTKTHYGYDRFGNLNETTVSAPYGIHGEQPRTVSFHYGSSHNHRLLTKETQGDDTESYVTTYDYDFHDHLDYTRDCNLKVIKTETTPSGNDQLTHHFDGTEQRNLVLWAQDSPYAPDGAAYYTWGKSTGGVTSMTFYHKTGLELRTVTFGFDGTPIYIDKRYNSEGLLEKVSAPYRQGESEDSIKWTEYLYDNHDRVVSISHPDNSVTSNVYYGLNTTTTTTPEMGEPQTITRKLNAMGWLEESIEAEETGTPTSVYYEYYPDGNLKWTRINDDYSTTINLQYDHAGNRTLLHDPDYCTDNADLTSVYNAFGEEISTTTPKGLTTAFLYDNFGRMTHRIEEEPASSGGTETKTTVWSYYTDDDEHHKGLLHSVTYPGQTVTYYYNSNQLVRKREDGFGGGETYTTRYSYDEASRLSTVLHPSGVYINYHYNRHGYLCSHTGSDGLYYRTEKMNSMGQIERFALGANIVSRRTYHTEKHLVTGIYTSKGENILQNLTYHYDGFCNLEARIDNQRNLEETFTYDHLNRLTEIWTGTTQSGWMDYDSYGRMTRKVADNLLVFSNAVYDETAKPHAIDRADTYNSVFTEQSVTYTCFDKVKTVTQGSNTLEYAYGYDRQRIFMEEHTGYGDRTKRYVGNCELLTETTTDGTDVRWLTCLVGPTGSFAMVETDERGNSTLHYILKDNLGSWSVITDRHGNIEQELSFDAWGNLRNPETWRTWSGMPEPMFDRGFTGHEHLYAFGLINMNGRMYDPQMSGFLSVDAYVQSPENAQGFNRYAYCMNNPLRYTDPSGWRLCGPMPGNPFHDNWSRSFVEPVYEPRDLGLEQLTDYEAIWMRGEELHGGGGGEDGGRGVWYVLKGIRNFEISNQDDTWNNPKKCKYVCLEMIEKWFLGEGARTAKELQEIAEEKDNKYDKYDLFSLYSKLSAEYCVEYFNDNTTTAIIQSINEGCPIIMGMEKFDTYGNIIGGHAVVIVGIYLDDNRYELKVADPACQNKNFTHITSTEIAREHKINNVGLEMIKFKPY